MSIHFINKGILPIEALTTMGVSIKPGTDTPFGEFGTGIKYAIATLLRTGHTISIWCGTRQYKIGVDDVTIRGKDFSIVTVGGQRTGFTTELGKKWEVWQAYRELRCNAMDEGHGWGVEEVDESPSGEDGWTTITVSGDPIAAVHEERAKYFCTTTPVHTCRMHGEMHDGVSGTVFYRGVAVGSIDGSGLSTYNITGHMALTEDRTMKYPWEARIHIGHIIASSPSHGTIERAVLAPDGTMEHSAVYDGARDVASDAFVSTMRRLSSNVGASKSAVKLFREIEPSAPRFTFVTLDHGEMGVVQNSLRLLRSLDRTFHMDDPEEVSVCEFLGENILGLYADGRIYISYECFALGERTVAATIYEEWLHKTKSLLDCSRGMQEYLLKQLIAMGYSR